MGFSGSRGKSLEQTDYVGVDIAPSPPPPSLQRTALSCQCASHTPSAERPIPLQVTSTKKAQLEREQNAHFQTHIEQVGPEECWHSVILFQRLTIFNLKGRQRPFKKPLDSIECDQIGNRNLQ